MRNSELKSFYFRRNVHLKLEQDKTRSRFGVDEFWLEITCYLTHSWHIYGLLITRTLNQDKTGANQETLLTQLKRSAHKMKCLREQRRSFCSLQKRKKNNLLLMGICSCKMTLSVYLWTCPANQPNFLLQAAFNFRWKV